MPKATYLYIYALTGWLAFALLVSACHQQPKSARPHRTPPRGEAPGFISKGGAPVYASNVPLQFSFASEVPATMADACARAAKTLNSAAQRELIQFESSVDRPFRIRWLANPSRASTHQASTELTIDSRNNIVGAEIHFDTKNFVYSESPDATQVDSESVCLHELGHALGLAHSKSTSSFMYELLLNGQIRRTLSTTDREHLRRVY